MTDDLASLQARVRALTAALERVAILKVSREEFIMHGPAFAARRASEMVSVAEHALARAAGIKTEVEGS